MTTTDNSVHDGVVFTTSQVVLLTGLHPRTLEAFERAGIVSPRRSAAGQASYDQHDLVRLRQARNLVQRAGMDLDEVRQLFAVQDQIEQTRQRLDQMVTELWEILDRTHPQWASVHHGQRWQGMARTSDDDGVSAPAALISLAGTARHSRYSM